MPIRSWLKRVTVVRFQEVVKRIAPSARVLVPERFRAYNLRDALS
jgi:putative transposon-encoded protein